MIINESVKLRTPSCVKQGLIADETASNIRTALLTSVNTLLNRLGKNIPEGWFSASDIVGGENVPWEYPWQLIHDAYDEAFGNHDMAYRASARDIGWFLLELLKNDERNFETLRTKKKRGIVRIYRWVD